MPKRCTDDVIHAVMTDHYIQRHKPNRDLLAALAGRCSARTSYRDRASDYETGPSRI